MYNWHKANFETAAAPANFPADGLVYKGLGLSAVMNERNGNWIEEWDITDLATGALLGTITDLDRTEALKVATMMADDYAMASQ